MFCFHPQNSYVYNLLKEFEKDHINFSYIWLENFIEDKNLWKKKLIVLHISDHIFYYIMNWSTQVGILWVLHTYCINHWNLDGTGNQIFKKQIPKHWLLWTEIILEMAIQGRMFLWVLICQIIITKDEHTCQGYPPRKYCQVGKINWDHGW